MCRACLDVTFAFWSISLSSMMASLFISTKSCRVKYKSWAMMRVSVRVGIKHTRIVDANFNLLVTTFVLPVSDSFSAIPLCSPFPFCDGDTLLASLFLSWWIGFPIFVVWLFPSLCFWSSIRECGDDEKMPPLPKKGDNMKQYFQYICLRDNCTCACFWLSILFWCPPIKFSLNVWIADSRSSLWVRMYKWPVSPI